MDSKIKSFTQASDANQPKHRFHTAYEAVDPFKPSIAFSLRNLAPESPEGDTNLLEDDRPPIRPRPLKRPPPPAAFKKSSKKTYGYSPWYRPVAAIPTIPPPMEPERLAPTPIVSGIYSERTHHASQVAEGAPSEAGHEITESQLPAVRLHSPRDVSRSPSPSSDMRDGPSRPGESWSAPLQPPLSPSHASSIVSSIPRPPSPSTVTSSLPQSSPSAEYRPDFTSETHQPAQNMENTGIHPASPHLSTRLNVPASTDHLSRSEEGSSSSQTDTRTYSPNNYVVAFLIDTLPRQIYLNLLLRLPYLYFSRVTRIFEEAEMSMPMIRQGILDAARANAKAMGQGGMSGQGFLGDPAGRGWNVEMEPTTNNAAYNNLQSTWLAFIDSLLQEWQTLNIISVLLLSAILTILQIQTVASDPVTRSSALLSMICALMSLVYGCIYIIRFATLKKTYKGAAWAQEAQRSKTGIWWNIWVMLAMPATWLAWSLILFVVTIAAFVWRTSPFQNGAPPEISPRSSSLQILVPRVLITIVLSMGILYFILIALTLRRYGDVMDRAWQKRIWGWIECVADAGAEEIQYPAASGWYTQLHNKKRYPKDEEEASDDLPEDPGDDDDGQLENSLSEQRSSQWGSYNQVQPQPFPDTGQSQLEDKTEIIARPPDTSLILDLAASKTLSPLHSLQHVHGFQHFQTPRFVEANTDRPVLLIGDDAPHAEIISPELLCASSQHDFVKLCDLPLYDDYLGIEPSPDDLKKCGLGLDAFNFRWGERNGWEMFKEHVNSVFQDDSFQDPPDNPPPDTVPRSDSLWLVLDLWTAKLQFNGVTGFLASCEPRPGDRALPIYYFHERDDHSGSSPSESSH